MQKSSVFVLTLALSLFACGGSPPPAPVGPGDGSPQDTEPAEGGPFKELKLFEGDKHVLTMRVDGVVILVEKNAHVGTLKPDGTMEITGGGGTAKLNADGTITLNGETLPMSIRDDATIVIGGKVDAGLNDDGTISNLREGAKPMRWEGADTPELKRYAMFLLILLSSDQANDTAPPPNADGDPRKAPVKDEMRNDEDGEEDRE